MENELLLTSKQLEEERSRQRDLKKKVDEVEEEKGLTNQQYEAKIAQVQEDMEELKNRLVAVTRYDVSNLSVASTSLSGEVSVQLQRSAGRYVTATKRGKTYSRSQAREKSNRRQTWGNIKPQPSAAGKRASAKSPLLLIR